MGTFSEFFNMAALVKSGSKKLKANPDDIKAAAAMWSKAKSISAQASKYVLEYPVACTDSITDLKTALAISKLVEYDCARFIILAAGLNPIIKHNSGDTIEMHLNDLLTSYENYSGYHCEITPASQEALQAAQNYMDNVYSSEEYNIFNKSEFSLEVKDASVFDDSVNDNPIEDTNNYDFDSELTDENIAKLKQTEIYEDAGNHGPRSLDHDPGTAFDKRFPKPTDSSKLKEWETKRAEFISSFDDVGNTYSGVKVDDSILRGLGKHQPTVINVTFVIADGNGVMRDFNVPLAIRSNIHFIGSKDIKDILTKVNSPNHNVKNLIKLTSGEVHLFRDLIFQIEESKRDVERERALGSMPIYRRLMANKHRHDTKTLASHIPIIKNFIARKNQKDLPMCTVIITEQELVDITKVRLNQLLKDRRFIDYVMDTYMLLGLGIVDEANDVIYLFYSGEKDYNIYSLSKVTHSSDADLTNQLATTLDRMTALISRR